jgi:hypothetical protein
MMGSPVFISYRRSDVAIARALAKLLTSFGQQVFLDVNSIGLGARWEEEIENALYRANTLLVLWSRSAQGSEYMQREIAGIRKGECKVVPVRLDGSPLPPELEASNALEIPAHLMWLGRVSELVRDGRMSHADAVAQLGEELKKDGIDLTPAQQRRAAAYAQSVSGGAGAVSGVVALILWWLRRGLQWIPTAPTLATLLLLGGASYVAAYPPTRAEDSPPSSSGRPDLTALRPDPDQVCKEIRSCTGSATPAATDPSPEAAPRADWQAAIQRQLRTLADTQEKFQAEQQKLAAAQAEFLKRLDGLGRCPVRLPGAPNAVPASTDAPATSSPVFSTSGLAAPVREVPASTLRSPVATQATEPGTETMIH